MKWRVAPGRAMALPTPARQRSSLRGPRGFERWRRGTAPIRVGVLTTGRSPAPGFVAIDADPAGLTCHVSPGSRRLGQR